MLWRRQKGPFTVSYRLGNTNIQLLIAKNRRKKVGYSKSLMYCQALLPSLTHETDDTLNKRAG